MHCSGKSLKASTVEKDLLQQRSLTGREVLKRAKARFFYALIKCPLLVEDIPSPIEPVHSTLEQINHMETKLKIIFFPFLLWCITISIAYPILATSLQEATKNTQIANEAFTLFLPAILIASTLLWLFRGRLEILKHADGRFRMACKTLMFFITLICLTFALKFLQSATNELKRIENLPSLPSSSSKYFTSDTLLLNTYRSREFLTRRDIGQSEKNDQTTYILHVAIPTSGNANIWMGKTFFLPLPKTLGDVDLNRRLNQFIKSSKEIFFSQDLSEFKYFEILDNTSERRGYIQAITGQSGPAESDLVIIKGHSETLPRDAAKQLSNYFATFMFGSLFLWILIAFPAIDPKRIEDLKAGRRPNDDFIATVLPYLNIRGLWPATAFLLLTQISIYFYMICIGIDPFFPSASEIAEFGGQSRNLVNAGDEWRLVTSMFVHYGIVHLLGNIIFLAIFGRMLEEIVGPYWLISLFVIFGLTGSIFSHIQYSHGVSAGASGAVFGLAGILLVFVWQRTVASTEKLKFWITLALLAISEALALTSEISSAGHAAHAGGFASGFITGCILANFYPKANKNQTNGMYRS